jgi:hypothetical protein
MIRMKQTTLDARLDRLAGDTSLLVWDMVEVVDATVEADWQKQNRPEVQLEPQPPMVHCYWDLDDNKLKWRDCGKPGCSHCRTRRQ